MDPAIIAALIAVVPSVLALFLILVMVALFFDEIRQAITAVNWRLKSGAAVKIASFELGQTYIVPESGKPSHPHAIDVRKDVRQSRYHERDAYYRPNRRLFLVHTLAPSREPNELYDIWIYLIPHKEATLAAVQKVEYYFGKYWNERIFVSTDRATGFRLSTSAYGPFVCTALLHFTDGETTMIWRYVDFEMGRSLIA